jgi:hypothetical protein
MSISSISGTGSRKHIGRRDQLLLAGLLAVALAVGVLAVFAPAPSVATPAAGSNADAVAAIQRQETLKDQRLDRMGALAMPVTSLSTERADEHRWLNERAASAAALVAAEQHQEELKEQWLARRGVAASTTVIAAAAARNARLRAINETLYPAGAEACNLACQYIIQQEKLDMCEELCVP